MATEYDIDGVVETDPDTEYDIDGVVERDAAPAAGTTKDLTVGNCV